MAASSAAERSRLDHSIAATALDWIGDRHRIDPSLTVAAYEQLRTEPPTRALLRELRGLGVRTLAPITRPGAADGTGRRLDWTDGRSEAGPEELARADVILVPALAADHRGTRLGRGQGYYDRALRHRRTGVAVLAVVYPPEWVASLPADPHDVPVDGALTDGVVHPVHR